MRYFSVAALCVFFHLGSFAQDETSVLFIGNSFTFMNDMPFQFKAIAESKGKKVFVDTVVEGGKNLQFHSEQEETYRQIKSRQWDYVVVQAHSNELAQPDSKVVQNTLPYAKKIVDSIRANSSCTRIILYMTWGYRYGNPKWSAISTYDSMQYRITNQYLRFADLLDTRLSPVGEVWRSVRAEHSGINLYDPDNFHPNPTGSYLSACTFFASIFGESPIGNTVVNDIPEATRQIIEFAAAQTVLNHLNKWRYVPVEAPAKASFDLILQQNELKIYNRSSGYSFLEWQFGDGGMSSDPEPHHTYQQKGKYDITLKLYNRCKTITLTRSIEWL